MSEYKAPTTPRSPISIAHRPPVGGHNLSPEGGAWVRVDQAKKEAFILPVDSLDLGLEYGVQIPFSAGIMILEEWRHQNASA